LRNRPWRGDAPADDDEARDRIVSAAMRCIDRHGPLKTGLSDVALELGVTRQTVYRHFPSTDDLFQAVSIAAADSFVDQLVARSADLNDLADMLVESIAFTVEHLDQERYLSLLLVRGLPTVGGQNFTSEIPTALTRALLDRLPIDWESLGLRAHEQDQLVEIYLRTLQSLLLEPNPRRTAVELREFIRIWFAPAVEHLTHIRRRE
jgi:AcrR family transcriptional regulator